MINDKTPRSELKEKILELMKELGEYKNLTKEQRVFIDEIQLSRRKLTTELIQVKEEKAHNEQLLDAFQNTLADFGYKLVSTNE